jgi:hypothetical protein
MGLRKGAEQLIRRRSRDDEDGVVMKRLGSIRPVAIAVAAMAIATSACGGHTNSNTANTGKPTGDASVETGGASSGGSGGSNASGGVSGAPSTGGAASTGGAPNCAFVDCTPISCGPGEKSVILPGECCPSLCTPPMSGGTGGAPSTGPQIDAGTCVTTPAPACDSNGFPYCAPSWTDAMSWYPTCPEPQIGAYLASCGGLNAIVVPGRYVERRYFYDNANRLAGYEGISQGNAHCEAYLGGFQAPSQGCVPLSAPCLDGGSPVPPPGTLAGIDAGAFVTWGAGPPDCKTGQAAYDAYLASQLAQFNTCTQDYECDTAPGGPELGNPCVEPCGLVFSVTGINSQIAARLDDFGNVACALCDAGPPSTCGTSGFFGKCTSGHCASGP